SVPAHNGSTRQMTKTGSVRQQAPQWSPDGQTIAYLSDATGETEIYTMPQLGGAATQITTLKKTITGYSYSPDGKKFSVFTVDNGGYIVDVDTKAVTKFAQSLYGFAGS